MILATLALHGIGLGLFQVAYADIVVGALPRQERGVAGSLTMVTRTVGVMGAATALTAALHAIEGRLRAAGASDAVAFEHAFSTVFLYAALLLAAFLALSEGCAGARGVGGSPATRGPRAPLAESLRFSAWRAP